KEKLRGDLVALVQTSVHPALRRYRDFLRATYLGAARTDVGVAANPHGRACYQALVRYHTTLELSPEQIHQIGMDELARLHGEMDGLARRAGFADWRAYFAALEKSPEQYLKTREELLLHNQETVARATAALPRAFGRMPPWGVQVTAIEAFRAAYAPAAYYYESPD